MTTKQKKEWIEAGCKFLNVESEEIVKAVVDDVDEDTVSFHYNDDQEGDFYTDKDMETAEIKEGSITILGNEYKRLIIA